MSGDAIAVGPRGALAAATLAILVAVPAPPLDAQTLLTEHTRTRDAAATPPSASVADVAWLTGRWVGEGLGATAEEAWLPPAGGAMAGVFRIVRDGSVEFYEILTLAEDSGSLVLTLKHFGADLVGWEEREDTVRFPLVHRDAETLWFDGLTIRRDAPDRMRIWVALSREGETPREALFTYRRAPE